MVDIRKIGALVASGVLVGGLGMVAGANLFPKTIVEYEDVEILVPVEVEVPYEVVVEVPVEVEKIVEVDNENLRLVLDYLYDEGGDARFVTSGLDDDELDVIVDRIVFKQEVPVLVEDAVKDEWRDLVHREWADDGRRIFDSEIERVRYSEDVASQVLDFDYKDAEGSMDVSFRHDGNSYEATFNVEIEDGRVVDVFLVGQVRLV